MPSGRFRLARSNRDRVLLFHVARPNWSYVLGVVRFRLLVVAVMLALVACGEREGQHADIAQRLIDRNGDPSINGGVDPYGDGRGSVVGWRTCPTKRRC